MSTWRDALDREIDAIAAELRATRRHLHAHPEPSREEFQTTRYVADRLGRAGIAHRIVASGRGIVAGPEGCPAEGPRVALRADMDALRLHDAKAVEYRSTRDGVMHACGHDAHTAMALGAALALHRCGDALPTPIAWRAIFQPAEEVGEGAAEMVAAGAVEGVDSIVALHVAPELVVGRVALRRGFATAYCQEIDVTIRGEAGHAARPHLTVDPIAAAAQFIGAVYQAMPRAFDSREPTVVSFGSIAGGSNANVIPDRVALRGTLRTMGRATAQKVRERLAQIAHGVAEASRAEVVLAFGSGTDSVINDLRVSDICAQAAGEVVGDDQVEFLALPSMGGEDFSGYLDHARGCMLRLGVAPPTGLAARCTHPTSTSTSAPWRSAPRSWPAARCCSRSREATAPGQHANKISNLIFQIGDPEPRVVAVARPSRCRHAPGHGPDDAALEVGGDVQAEQAEDRRRHVHRAACRRPGLAGRCPGPAAISRPSGAWFASSGPVSFSKVWIAPVPTVPTDRQRRSPK